MDIYNKILSKSSNSWNDVQRNLKSVLQTRNFSTNKIVVKQCIDLLVKHMNNLNQVQVSEQLESLSQTSQLGFSKLPSQGDPSTLTTYLHSDDFYFEIPIKVNGEIGDVKYAMFHEPLQSSKILKDIFCSFDWDLLQTSIENIKSIYILNDAPFPIKENGFKAMRYLETDLNELNNYNKKYYKSIDAIVNTSLIGLFKKGEIGFPMKLYYYVSQQDLIFDANNKKYLNNLTENDILTNECGSSLSISLESCKNVKYKLPDCSMLNLNDQMFDESNIFDRKKDFTGYELPGTFMAKLNRPLVMGYNIAKQIETAVGIEFINDVNSSFKTGAYLDLLAKTVNGNVNGLYNSYFVQLPDEAQIYYFQPNHKQFLGIEITKIPFTNASQLQSVIKILRYQHLFNELILSCMRHKHHSGSINRRVLEISLNSFFSLSVTFEHPNRASYTKINIEINENGIQISPFDPTLCDPFITNEIIKKCHSIPVTIRALLIKYIKTDKLSTAQFKDKNVLNGFKKETHQPTQQTTKLLQQKSISNKQNGFNDQSMETNESNDEKQKRKKQEERDKIFDLMRITDKDDRNNGNDDDNDDDGNSSSGGGHSGVNNGHHVASGYQNGYDKSSKSSTNDGTSFKNENGSGSRKHRDSLSELNEIEAFGFGKIDSENSVITKRSPSVSSLETQIKKIKKVDSKDSKDPSKCIKRHFSLLDEQTIKKPKVINEQQPQEERAKLKTSVSMENFNKDINNKFQSLSKIDKQSQPQKKTNLISKDGKKSSNNSPVPFSESPLPSPTAMSPMSIEQQKTQPVNMKIKPITKDGLKIRISKEATLSSSSTTTSSTNATSPSPILNAFLEPAKVTDPLKKVKSVNSQTPMSKLDSILGLKKSISSPTSELQAQQKNNNSSEIKKIKNKLLPQSSNNVFKIPTVNNSSNSGDGGVSITPVQNNNNNKNSINNNNNKLHKKSNSNMPTKPTTNSNDSQATKGSTNSQPKNSLEKFLKNSVLFDPHKSIKNTICSTFKIPMKSTKEEKVTDEQKPKNDQKSNNKNDGSVANQQPVTNITNLLDIQLPPKLNSDFKISKIRNDEPRMIDMSKVKPLMEIPSKIEHQKQVAAQIEEPADIFPESPFGGNECEPTTIPILIPLERDNLNDDVKKVTNNVDVNKFHNSPEIDEDNLIIDFSNHSGHAASEDSPTKYRHSSILSKSPIIHTQINTKHLNTNNNSNTNSSSSSSSSSNNNNNNDLTNKQACFFVDDVINKRIIS